MIRFFQRIARRLRPGPGREQRYQAGYDAGYEKGYRHAIGDARLSLADLSAARRSTDH